MLVEPGRATFGRRQSQFQSQSQVQFRTQPLQSYQQAGYGGSERIVMARWKVVLLLMISLGFMAIFAMVPVAEWSFKFWFGALIFGSASLIFGVILFRPTSLELDAQGFTYLGGLTKTRRIAWGDIEGFFLWKPPRGARMVAYKYKDGARPASMMGSLNRLVGVDGSLPNLFAIKPQALVEKLETYRQRAR